MFRSTGVVTFEKLLEKATSNLLLEVDLYSVIGICDLIRQKDCPPKYAIAAIKKKLSHQNPHVVFYALQVLESIVKNCGSPIHEEIATKEFMDYLRDLAKATTHDNVRDKILELIQAWAHAFRKLPAYRAVQDFVNIMKAEGCKFPPLIEADAMFCADTAPEWQDGGCCNRCRTEFGLMNRKHHCRACGQIFCAKCSSKQATLPKFGIEKEVRVCDSCYDKYGKDNESIDDTVDMLLRSRQGQSVNSSKSPPLQHSQTQQPRGKTEEELQEEEQLQLALAISQSEAEAKEREKLKSSTDYASSPTSNPISISLADRDSEKVGSIEKNSAPKKSAMSGKTTFEQDDPELARYLDRNYWEQRHGQTTEESTREETGTNLHNSSSSPFQPSAPIKENKNKVESVEEIDGFVESLRGQIEVFVNRMRSNSSRGRHISNDTTVQTLFMNITALHSQLLTFIQAQDNWRGYYEGLQEKLNQVHDARDALDALRREHGDRLRQIAEDAERQRQVQMSIKLQDMRQKKHQYLQYMRDIALRKVQDEEKQMQMRIDQQRMGGYGAYPIPGQGYMGGQMPPGMVPPGMVPPGMMPSQDPQMQYMQHQQPPQHYVSSQPSNVMLGQPQQHQIPQIPVGHYQPHQQAQFIGHPGMQGPMSPPSTAIPMQQGQNQILSPHHNQQQPTSHQGQEQMQSPIPTGQIQQGPQQMQQIPQGQMPPQQGPMQMLQHQQGPIASHLQQGQGQIQQGQNQMQQGQGQMQPSQHQVPVTQQQQQQHFYPPQTQQQQQQQQLPMSPPSSFHPNGSNHDMTQQNSPQIKNEPLTAELISFD